MMGFTVELFYRDDKWHFTIKHPSHRGMGKWGGYESIKAALDAAADTIVDMQFEGAV